MSLTYDHELTDSGLLVPKGSQEASVRASLKAHDPGLMLDYALDQQHGKTVWQVLKRVSADRPPMVVCRWRDQLTGEPLPLSHQLVEHVKGLDLNSRAPRIDADAANEVARKRREQDADAELEEYAAELVDRLRGRTIRNLPRGTYRRNTQFRDITGIR